ncbi:MAG: alkaline phosphatase family protein [Gammaproteobacteria bacterium]|nr:alkaline phosphatase family protein [Gammaproteobacteria bacterium]
MNILFITADQWRGECLSILNHPHVKTPNLDALAQESILFKRHYVQATPCAPSRTSLHTGMYLQNHRCVSNGTPVDRNFDNWAQVTRRAGYDPSLFGYTDTATDPRGLSDKDPRLTHYSEPLPGIGSYTAYKNDVSVDWVQSLISKGYEIPEPLCDLYGNKTDGVDWAEGGEVPLPLAIKAEDNETFFMVDKCLDWIAGQQKPWITHLSLLRPHPPFAAPEPYNRLYDPASLGLPERRSTIKEEGSQHPLLEFYLDDPGYVAPESDRKMRQAKANYYGLISEVDDNLGRLLDTLKARGEWENTLIIFTSDHGEQLGDHWLRNKLGYFDQSYHVPLIIRDPRSSADPGRGKQVEAFSENVDIMPTMLEWLGLDVPSSCDGMSLMPIINSGEAPDNWRQEVYWEYDFRDVLDDSVEKHFGLTSHQCNLAVVRDEKYKYVHFGALPPLFFDLQEDPQEFVNQANNPDYQSLMLEYVQKMLSWRMNHTHRGLTETFLAKAGPVTRYSAVRKSG